MKRLYTIKKLIVAPALVIALTAGSIMAGPRDHFGSGDRLGGAMSGQIASRAYAKQMAEHKIGSFKSGNSVSSSHHVVDTSAIGDDVLARYVFTPTEASFLKTLFDQR
ncbi:hypothetical protein [Roseovarius sp. EL26]|uniref:hypothetical protein n=1 Tax=Roseovarius sp. EL26 TaxID=2126672 RepID=UPI000EA0638B|nr:hypothetical protein [Roseovarius sp. EL26]